MSMPIPVHTMHTSPTVPTRQVEGASMATTPTPTTTTTPTTLPYTSSTNTTDQPLGQPIHPLQGESAAVGSGNGDEGAQRSLPEEVVSAPPIEMVHVRALIISGDSHVFSFEPETTVGRMKELIWSMWPSDWTSPAQPPSANFIRILHAGRVLSDDSTLISNNLPASISSAQPTVIHISVRSFSIRNEEDPKKPSLLHPVRSRHTVNNDEEVGGCKCVIM